MLLFWKIYFIVLGITILFALMTFTLFTTNDKENIPFHYVIFASFICAIPGVGMLASPVLIVVAIIAVVEGELIPRKFDSK
jgi:RsiW-degrading membrane proteinase PrsW (M82 family)